MPDEDVVALAREGQPEAAEYLLGHYRGLVENKARAYYVRGADREDVVQEGMIGLCKAIRDYDGDRLQSFKPFAEICVTRQIISAVKAATRQKHTPLNGSVSLNQSISDDSTDISLLEAIPDNRDNPEMALINKQVPEKLNKLMSESLSPLEQGVLNGYLTGKSYQEMSVDLHCRTKAIDNALQRIKKKVGQLLVETA